MGATTKSEVFNETPLKKAKGFQKGNTFSRFAGREHSDETKAKMRVARLLNQPMRNPATSKKMAETRSANGSVSGEKNHNWQGGNKNYRGPHWRTQRVIRKQLDGYACQDCGKKESDNNMPLDVHHLIDFKDGGDNSIDNLITLCRSCHNKRRKNNR